MVKSRRTREQIVKIAFSGIALLSTWIIISQLKLVSRVLSAVDLEIDRSTEASLRTTQNKTATVTLISGPRDSEPSLAGAGPRFIWNVSSVPPSSLSSSPEKRKLSFKTHREFSEELMDEFLSSATEEAAKRRRRKQLEKKRQKDKKRKTKKTSRKVKLKVPTPIFVPSLPKSGTTTTHQYFQCGGQKSAHLAARNGDDIFRIGRCAQRNVMEGRAPFAGCGDYDVWTDTGYVATQYQPGGQELKKNNIQCFYPLISHLNEVYAAHPNATFLFVVRETEGWLKSVQSYHDGFIMDVWKRCRTPGFPGLEGTVNDFRELYEWHKEMIRNFALEHPSWTYIEVDLESPDAGQTLQDQMGIDASCWGHHNQGKERKPDKSNSGNHQLIQDNSEEE